MRKRDYAPSTSVRDSSESTRHIYSGQEERPSLANLRYREMEDGLFVFSNPAYTGETAVASVSRTLGSNMRLKDFLASIASFADFSENQLLKLEKKASIAKFQAGEVVFKQVLYRLGYFGRNWVINGFCYVLCNRGMKETSFMLFIPADSKSLSRKSLSFFVSETLEWLLII